jgi:putative ABC transport system ATP-binding protein
MSEYLLETRDLAKVYEGGRIEALRGVDLQVYAGEFVAIRGPSGSGKSALLHLLGGLDTPSRGAMFHRGMSLAALPGLDAYRSRCVGFVFQAFHLLPSLSVLDNVQVPMCECGLGRGERREKAAALLREVGMEDRARQRPNQLSTGERCQGSGPAGRPAGRPAHDAGSGHAQSGSGGAGAACNPFTQRTDLRIADRPSP